MWTRRVSLLAGAVVLASLVSCGQNNSPSSPGGAGSSPSLEQGQAGFGSIKEARSEYLRLLEPVAVSTERLSKLLDQPNAAVPDLQKAVADYASESEAVAASLRERTWPDEVAAPIADLVRQLNAQVAPLKQAAAGTSDADIRQRLGSVPAATAAEQVSNAFKNAGA